MPAFLSHPSMTTVWVGALVLFLIVEGLTVGLTSIWFAIGALAAMLGAMAGLTLWLQVLLFLLVSALSVWLTRPLVKKRLNPKRQATNADRVIGAEGRVTERLDNLAGTGYASVDGKLWTARTASDSPIETGTLVRVLRIEGVKLIVEPVGAEAAPAAEGKEG